MSHAACACVRARERMFLCACVRVCVLVVDLVLAVLSGKINAWFRVQGLGFRVSGLGCASVFELS